MRQLKIQKSITNRASEALDKYLVEIGRAPLISIDEEIELAQKIKKGGPEGERAKDKLVTANLRFVVSVAKQEESISLFKRRVPNGLVSKALAIIVINLIVLMTSVLLLLVFDHGSFIESCYECVSALATVGLTKGLTPNLTIAGKVIIIITMYLGRVGPISMAIGFSQKNKKKKVVYPEQDLIL